MGFVPVMEVVNHVVDGQYAPRREPVDPDDMGQFAVWGHELMEREVRQDGLSVYLWRKVL